MVFAKDKKQVVTLAVVMLVLAGNTIYMIAKYVMDQMPQTNTTAQNTQPDQTLEETNPGAPGQQNPQQAAKGDPNQNPNGAPQTSTGTPQPVAPASAPPSFPFIPIIFVLLALIAGAFIVKKLSQNNGSSSDKQTSANNSSKKSGKMVFAKDKKQVVTMFVVLSAFVLNTIYMIVKYFQDQAPQTNAPAATSASVFPLVIVVVVVLALTVLGFIAKKLLGKAPSDPRQKTSSASYTKKNSNSAKKPGKMVFAKDKKQVVTMLVVLTLFLGNTVYMIAKYVMDQMPQKPAQNSAQSAEDQMAMQQQQDLQSLNNPNQQNDTGQNNDVSISQDANNIYMQTMNQQGAQEHPGVNGNLKTIQANDNGDVDILVKNKLPKSSKMVFVSVSNSGRSNPFLPAAENVVPGSMSYLTAPPETALQSSDAGKVMSTTISGILYDKYNPSAIINIEGSDYLVKTGDVIHNYKVLSITQNQVLVQLGKNIYKAGVGELLSETDLKYNVIANLNKKFGGNNVSINVRKKRK